MTLPTRTTFISRAIALINIALICGLLAAAAQLAISDGGGDGHSSASVTFLWIAIVLLAAKFSSLIERFGQPAVLGELLAGVAIGNLGLLGLHMFEPIAHDPIITFLAELGVVILLFQIGLESNIKKLGAVGGRALLVATVGVVVPFILGTYIVGPWLMPGLGANAYLFLGAALTATSVGITARVFSDLKKLHLPEAQIVLGAAVIDDVMGLIILAVVSAIATVGAISAGAIGVITGKAIFFLVGSIVIGHIIAPRLGQLFSRIHGGAGMKLTLAISFGLIFAWLAGAIGLAPIVGAFAAGLVLDPVHFRFFKAEHHIEGLIEPIGHFLVPIFFVVTGMGVKLETLFDLPILLVALGITVVAVVGKIVSGLAAGKVRKSLVGWGMVPRGEVGLIFASIGLSLGVVTDDIYSIIVIMVILTTLITPVILTHLLKRS
jgi:Kef-type K+ transport system membrane component KefB